MKIALDSNILIYAAGVHRADADIPKTSLVRSMIDKLTELHSIVAPFQTFGEAYSVMQRFGRSREDCRATIQKWIANFETISSSENAFLSALDLATDHKLQFWDALIVNAAADAGCVLLLSEDMQSGFTWRGVTIANPFAETLEPQLHAALAR
jgi:predicted nucleic acid-binding protein